MLFQFGDVGIGRDHAAASGLALADPDPTAIAAVLDVRRAGTLVTLEAFSHPSVGASVRLLYQSAIDGGTDNRLEAGAGLHDVRMRRKQVPVSAVAHDELVVRIVERESLRDALDRVSEAAPRFANFLEIRLLHLHSRCAEYGQGLGHTTDLARLNTTAAIRIQVLHSTTESAAMFAPVMSRLALSTSSSTRALKPLERETFSAKRRVALVVRSSSLLRNAGMLSVPLMKGRSSPTKPTIGCFSLGSSSKVKRSNSLNACWSRKAATG